MVAALVMPLLFAGWNAVLVTSVRNLRVSVEHDVGLTIQLTTLQQRVQDIRNGALTDAAPLQARLEPIRADVTTLERRPEAAIVGVQLQNVGRSLRSGDLASVDANFIAAVAMIRQRLVETSATLGSYWNQLAISSVGSVVLALAFAILLKSFERAYREVRTLRGVLPICMYCKNIRDDQNYWKRLEEYVSSHSEAQFSHGICPECYKNVRATLDAEERP